MTIGVDLNVPSYASLNIHSCSSDSSPRLDQAAQKTWHSTTQHVAQTHKIKNIYKRIPRLTGVKLSSHVCFVFFIINLFLSTAHNAFCIWTRVSMEAEWRRTARAHRRWWWRHLQEHGWSNGTTPRYLSVNPRHCFPGCGVCTCSPSGSQCHRQHDIAEGLYQNRVHVPPRARELSNLRWFSDGGNLCAFFLCFLLWFFLGIMTPLWCQVWGSYLTSAREGIVNINGRQPIWINDWTKLATVLKNSVLHILGWLCYCIDMQITLPYPRGLMMCLLLKGSVSQSSSNAFISGMMMKVWSSILA